MVPSLQPPSSSHAQWGDDRLVLEYFGANHRGVFLEAGAHDPKRHSRTWLLEQNGWSGVLVEPIPSCCEALRRERPNSQVFSNALGAPGMRGQLRLRVPAGASELTHVLPSDENGSQNDSCARLARNALRRRPPSAQDRVIEAPLSTLNQILHQANLTQLDLLALDLGGFELPALKGLDLQRVRPRLIIVADPLENFRLHWYLRRRGYRLVKRNGTKNWYVPAGTDFPLAWSERWQLLRRLYLPLSLRQTRTTQRRRPARPSSLVAVLQGGLGRQLFIYATARALALRTGRQLYLDTLREDPALNLKHPGRLDRFPISAQPVPAHWRLAPGLQQLRQQLVRGLNKLLPRNHRTYFSQLTSAGPEQLTRLRPRRQRISLDGDWQDEAFFAEFAALIRRELTPPPPNEPFQRQRGAQYAATDTVFIHVRRAQFRPQLGADYYQQAIDWLRAEHPSARFAVFGDDPDWARQQLDFDNASVDWVTGNDELTDLWLMSQCRHAIVANSRFGWWGAWLNQMPGPRTVVFPAQPGRPLLPAQGWLRQSHQPAHSPA